MSIPNIKYQILKVSPQFPKKPSFDETKRIFEKYQHKMTFGAFQCIQEILILCFCITQDQEIFSTNQL